MSKGYSPPSNICRLEMLYISPLYSVLPTLPKIYMHLYKYLHHNMSLLCENLPAYTFTRCYLSLFMVYFKEFWVYKSLSILPLANPNYSYFDYHHFSLISLINYWSSFLIHVASYLIHSSFKSIPQNTDAANILNTDWVISPAPLYHFPLLIIFLW